MAVPKREWWAALAWLAAIYASAPFARRLATGLRDLGLLRVSVAAAFALVVIGVVIALVRKGLGVRGWAVLALIAGGYAVALSSLDVVEERLHFFQYGILALLLERALRGTVRSASIVAAMLTALAGWGDELIQAVLPERVYDLRDVLFNTAAGIMALSALAAVRRLGLPAQEGTI